MLFNSLEFILLFLPITLVGFFWLCRREQIRAANGWLVLASLFFYSWWNPIYLPLLLGSIGFNYGIGTWLHRLRRQSDYGGQDPKSALTVGIAGNIALLGYFKYADFFLDNINRIAGAEYDLLRLVLPLGISFFTFTQIAFLVDVYRRQAQEYSLLNYSLFVTYFPHLIAGPILHHREMMPQFADTTNRVFRYENMARGLALFAIGLFKKVILADTFSVWANSGYQYAGHLTLVEAWAATLSYTLQLYFDFSGYTDMALGIAMMFNIDLPANFNSPYKARTIQDFWRRWHMTLSRFLKEYVYIPLGGNRFGESAMQRNLLITFLLGGIWHGAGWTFLAWGGLHGLALVLQRQWQKLRRPLPDWLAWLATFLFVHFTWVFFRAGDMHGAMEMLRSMFGMNDAILRTGVTPDVYFMVLASGIGNIAPAIGMGSYDLIMVLLGLSIVFTSSNSIQWINRFQPNRRWAIFIAGLLGVSLGYLSFGHAGQFLYFNF